MHAISAWLAKAAHLPGWAWFLVAAALAVVVLLAVLWRIERELQASFEDEA